MNKWKIFFVYCKGQIILVHYLQIQHATSLPIQRIVKFMIILNFMVLAFNNLVKCILAQPKVSFFFPCQQPKNPESVINLGILLRHVLRVLH
jgi:hypothetical protein